jgi:hypothetical protein
MRVIVVAEQRLQVQEPVAEALDALGDALMTPAWWAVSRLRSSTQLLLMSGPETTGFGRVVDS